MPFAGAGQCKDFNGGVEGMNKNFIVYDLVEENGKTIKENNLELQHNIPLGALVEVKFDNWFGGGACWKVHARLWVVAHSRDFDGTPLYGLSQWNDAEFAIKKQQVFYGFSEEDLIVVNITEKIRQGYDVLEWKD